MGELSRAQMIAGGLLLALGVATLTVWGVLDARVASDQLTVTFLDVGQGDAVLVETPHKRQVLIDAGKGFAAVRALGGLVPVFDRSLDLVVATHPDLDHIGGLPTVFERFRVGKVLISGVADAGSDAVALAAAITEEGIAPQVAQRGMVYALDENVALEVLHPAVDATDFEPNAGSVVLRLSYGETSFLLTGDAPAAIERYLVTQYGNALESTVLKVGHHGSRTSSDMRFVGTVAPSYAVVSRGCDNQYGHPHSEVLDTLTMFEIEVLDTCTDGTITFTSDGEFVVLDR